MVSRVIPVDEFDLVIFGGTGDLARRKILPGLFRRFLSGQMPGGSRIIGAARSDLDTSGYREMISGAVAEFGGEEASNKKGLDAFLQQLEYVAIDARGEGGWAELAKIVRQDVVQAFYFS
ncbi:MAG: glucose-6-phosphate dehydrogenase, partial [Pseudomonadota bacterium]